MNQFFQIGGQCRETVVESLHPYALMCRSENSPLMLRGPLIGDNWSILLLASHVFSRWDTSHGSLCCFFHWYSAFVLKQHVLEHGKPHERSTIIKELAGKIVQMSQQKFASNVVEKCLTFGGPSERQLLVDEMLGLTDENEPLQVG